MRGSAGIVLLAAIGCASVRTPVRRPLGGISGTVLDASTGGPVGGALIGVRDFQSAMSNARGDFALAPLVDGKYDLTVEHAGYLTASAEKIAVQRGYYTTLVVKLIRRPDDPADRAAALPAGAARRSAHRGLVRLQAQHRRPRLARGEFRTLRPAGRVTSPGRRAPPRRWEPESVPAVRRT